LLDGLDLRSLCTEADIVVHAAALVGVNRVCNAGRETLETNYVGTSRLLQALEGNKKLLRFIYFSTSEVFGVNSFRVDESSPPSVGPITEARWSYAIAKLAGEHLVKAFFRETGMPIVIVRPFNIFGPRRTGEHALLRFILNALNGKPVQVHGDGSQIRSWCYIEDFCSALVQMLERPEAVGEDFNIGNAFNTLTIGDLARKVVDQCGVDVPIQFIDHPFPDISIRVPSLIKAQSLLGYKPRYDLDLALSLTVDWYRKHLSFFDTTENKPAITSREPAASTLQNARVSAMTRAAGA
jgi:nucleoside-diphosphate-sugar epimerase